MNPYLFIALDLARERAHEGMRRAEHRRLLMEAEYGRPTVAARIRRQAARLLAGLSLASAFIVRRLDDHVADDLGRTLASAE